MSRLPSGVRYVNQEFEPKAPLTPLVFGALLEGPEYTPLVDCGGSDH
jgi:hypothetical protein